MSHGTPEEQRPPPAPAPSPSARSSAGRLGSARREVVRGRHTKSTYIRVSTTEARAGFRRHGGVLEATEEASQPRTGLGRLYNRMKATLIGAPLSLARLSHERLSKTKALAVFSSDAISSAAYATEEIVIVLALAGPAAGDLLIPISIAILVLLAIVTISYQQTIAAYPSGGGAYIVASENLGRTAGQAAAASLLVDYTLTVSLSIAAGIAAVIAAIPELEPYRVQLGVAAITLVTLLNLRGVSESGTIFSIPTYAFVATGFALLLVGALRIASGNAEPVVYEEVPHATQALTIFLVLRAFASGCTALSGVEAISNGVPAFMPPEARNASITMIWMAVILGILFMGVSLLTNYYGLQEVEGQTIVSQLGEAVFGRNLAFYVWQAATALILLLAANTSYADFPRLSSILAKDSYMPRQFAFRGDRLAFSNGIIVLGVAAAVLLVAFGGDVTRLIPLFALGVFLSFTFSQAGMVMHWWRLRGPGWRRGLAINLSGAITTAVVSGIIVLTKFLSGAWISILMALVLIALFRAIHRHYTFVDSALALPDPATPLPVTSRPQVVLVPVRELNRPVVRALAYARSLGGQLEAVHVTESSDDAEPLREAWEKWEEDVPLTVIESPYRSFVQPLLAFMDSIEDEDPETLITVVLPEFIPRHWWQTFLHNQDALRLKAALLFRKDTVVIDVPAHL